MLTLINTNCMRPPIAPVGLDYVAAAARRAEIDVEMLDLATVDDPATAIPGYFADRQPELIGLSLRNVDDCFWPSGESFLPRLCETVDEIRRVCDAPIVLGGVGFSIFAREIVELTGADFGIRGDGERAVVELVEELRRRRRFEQIDGLIFRHGGELLVNRPAWPRPLVIPSERDAVDNATYFRLGGQIGVETKRGCNRQCIYCADPLAKGPRLRGRDPVEVADEFESLLAQGVDVLHLCDAEFNLPPEHAAAVCDELIRRRLDRRVRWYAYLAVTPFDADLAARMARAGCVGINFTSDAASEAMLVTYRHLHRRDDLARAVRLCRENRIAVMLDMLLGGPGETPESVAETIAFFKQIDPDCAGAALGVRVYPETAMASIVAAEGPPETNPNLRRRYDGSIDLLRPTFYIASTLGKNPARLVRELIDGDPRFFEPEEEVPGERVDASGDHNYNRNDALSAAIAAGARGAYWDILRGMRGG